jgi:hypothetical protein
MKHGATAPTGTAFGALVIWIGNWVLPFRETVSVPPLTVVTVGVFVQENVNVTVCPMATVAGIVVQVLLSDVGIGTCGAGPLAL